MTNVTPELIEKAKQAKSPEELAELAGAAGMELTAEEAAAYFAQLNPKTGELSDDELENVSGGGCGSSEPGPAYETPRGFFTDGRSVENYNRLCCTFSNSGCATGERWHSMVPFRGVIHFTSRTQWYVTCNKCGRDVVSGNEHPTHSYLFVLAR